MRVIISLLVSLLSKIPDTLGGDYEKCYDSIEKEITIPPKSTVIVATDESIWVSPQIAGTYHSKVSLVSKGLGHIGAALDPTFLGTFFIALHNLSNQPVKLKRLYRPRDGDERLSAGK